MCGWEFGRLPELLDEDGDPMNLNPDRSCNSFNGSDPEEVDECYEGGTGELVTLMLTPGMNGMLTANKRSLTLSFCAEKSEPHLWLRTRIWTENHRLPHHRL